VQQTHFSDEIANLKQGNPVKLDSPLNPLTPFMKDGLICTGSRLKHSKHCVTPVILPNKDDLTTLLIRDTHSKNGHTGTEQVLATLRQRFWIIRGRAAVRRALSTCFLCRRQKAPLLTQQMAPVLEEQVTLDDPPFTNTGVDLFGPFHVKYGRGTIKRYGCIFTCLAMRAVHLEVVHTLNTDSFLAAISRFIARRGIPARFFSDNGTNLKAADKELRDGIKRLNTERLQATMATMKIDWHFNPPHASHLGGLWERLIRSVRSGSFALCDPFSHPWSVSNCSMTNPR
jgi:hypothetical protein